LYTLPTPKQPGRAGGYPVERGAAAAAGVGWGNGCARLTVATRTRRRRLGLLCFWPTGANPVRSAGSCSAWWSTCRSKCGDVSVAAATQASPVV